MIYFAVILLYLCIVCPRYKVTHTQRTTAASGRQLTVPCREASHCSCPAEKRQGLLRRFIVYCIENVVPVYSCWYVPTWYVRGITLECLIRLKRVGYCHGIALLGRPVISRIRNPTSTLLLSPPLTYPHYPSPLFPQHAIQPGRDQAFLPRGGAGANPGADVTVWGHGGQHGGVSSDGVVRLYQEPASWRQDALRLGGGGFVANLPHAVSERAGSKAVVGLRVG